MPTIHERVRNIRLKVNSSLLTNDITKSFTHRGKTEYICPICNYTGPFADVHPSTGRRCDAICPNCKAYERHRLQHLVFNKLSKKFDWSELSILHFAPEPFFRDLFRSNFESYTSADLKPEGVDMAADLLDLPCEDHAFDVVYASHVLEHITQDGKALSEIRRILKPGGIAILPVPIVGVETIEYAEPNKNEAFHVRAPGLDYFNRYETFFERVEVLTSSNFPDEHQLYLLENRSQWHVNHKLWRSEMPGSRHSDYVPVCYVGNQTSNP